MKILELDPDQGGTPSGYVAYILRSNMVYEGRLSKILLAGDKPDLYFTDGAGGCRLPKFEGETSRLFVAADGFVDPRVLELER